MTPRRRDLLGPNGGPTWGIAVMDRWCHFRDRATGMAAWCEIDRVIEDHEFHDDRFMGKVLQQAWNGRRRRWGRPARVILCRCG